MGVLNLIRYALSPRWEIHTGLTRSGSRWRYVTVAREGGHPVVLDAGESAKGPFAFMAPVQVHVDAGNVPATLHTGFLEGEDPAVWLKKHESMYLPSNEDTLCSTHTVSGDRIAALSIRHDAIDKMREQFDSTRFVPESISVALWSLAKIYWKPIGKNFCIWQIGPDSSVIGYVDRGILSRVFHFWAGTDDLKTECDDICSEATNYLMSVSGTSTGPVVVLAHSARAIALEELNIGTFEVLPPPDIKGVSPDLHPAYALALSDSFTPDFAQFAWQDEAKVLRIRRKKALGWMRSASIVTAGVLVLSAAAIGFTKVAVWWTQRSVAPIREKVVSVVNAQHTADSLEAGYRNKTYFLARESIVTTLLDQLQPVFPDGMWAEQITVGERDGDNWQVEIIAAAYSTSSIPTFMERIGKLPDISAVRMLYSENVRGDGKSKPCIKVKVACLWNGGRE